MVSIEANWLAISSEKARYTWPECMGSERETLQYKISGHEGTCQFDGQGEHHTPTFTVLISNLLASIVEMAFLTVLGKYVTPQGPLTVLISRISWYSAQLKS